jgi:VanZ family protein
VTRTFLGFLPLGLWAAAVLVIGGLEDLRTPPLPRHADKAAHFIMYGVGGALAAWAGRIRGRAAGLGALVFVWLVGLLDEVRQAWLPARQGDVWDWAADAAGALVFYVVAARVLRRR